MSSPSDSSSASGSGSRDNDLVSGSSGSTSGERGVQMEVIPNVREDPTKEVVENSTSAKAE